MRIMVGALAALALAGCATAPQYPAMRPLTAAHIETMRATPVVVSENNNGIEKAWFYTSTASAGAAYGLVGALVSAAMDAIINYGPSQRAQKAANEMAELMPVDALNASLVDHVRRQMAANAAPPAQTTEATLTVASADAAAVDATVVPASTDAVAATDAVAPVIEAAPPPPPNGVYYSDVQSQQRFGIREPLQDAVVITTGYTLSEDASTLRIIAHASYQSAETPYATPYTFARSVPRAETEGPAYRNTFTYYSTQLPVPTLTPELRERLIANIEESARDENGALPAEGTDQYRAMQRELENARDDRLSKDEIAIFLTREWLRDNGALLRRELDQAHEFIARYVLQDMNHTAAPSLTGSDELLETTADSRTVRRIGTGTQAGSYVSSAGNVSSFSTYGNAIGIARVHSQRLEQVRDAARDARESSRNSSR
jgi:hypothetical protein